MLNIRQTSKIFLFYAISEGKIRNLGPVSKIGTFLGSFLDFGTNREIWDLIGSTEYILQPVIWPFQEKMFLPDSLWNCDEI